MLTKYRQFVIVHKMILSSFVIVKQRGKKTAVQIDSLNLHLNYEYYEHVHVRYRILLSRFWTKEYDSRSVVHHQDLNMSKCTHKLKHLKYKSCACT